MLHERKMIKMGKMQEIKEFLEQGKTVKELIELGFKKPSIYKVKKQLKDVETDTKPGNELPEKTQGDTDEKPGTILDKTQENLNTESTTTGDTDNSDDNPGNTETEGEDPKSDQNLEGIEQEVFGDEDTPFREYNGVDIRRDVVNIPTNTLIPSGPKVAQTGKGGKIGLPELLTEVFSTIGIISGHDFWELSNKEQKVIKHLCKVPGLEKFLHKFGLYGCVIGLFTIAFKRIKKEIQTNKSNKDEKEETVKEDKFLNEGAQIKMGEITRPDSPSHIMAGLTE